MFVLDSDFEKSYNRIDDNKDRMLGVGLLQPFNNTNSGSRKLMFPVHAEQALSLKIPEKAIMETGYEIRFGDASSSLLRAEDDIQIIAFIPKFSFNPIIQYYAIGVDKKGMMHVFHKIPYHHVTESYGYMYKYETLDSMYLNLNTSNKNIKAGDILRSSYNRDEYGNYQYGINLNAVYMGLTDNIEDSIIISDAATKKLESTLVKPVTIIINENDIPIDLYGSNGNVKIMPDIGEKLSKDGRLLVLRRDMKDRGLYSQSRERLSEIHLSDTVYELSNHGEVIDIDIYCNNIPILDKYYNSQLAKYYNESVRCATEISSVVLDALQNGYKLSYDLDKLYVNSQRLLNNFKYKYGGSNFSNILLKVTVYEDLKTNVCDKLTNRYGGKGVISKIIPAEYMPRLEKDKTPVDIIICSDSVYNRENPAQLFELSVNHINERLITYIKERLESVDNNKLYEVVNECIDYIYTFLGHISNDLYLFWYNIIDVLSNEDKLSYLQGVIEDGILELSNSPMNESMTLDKLDRLYKELPFIEKDWLEVPIPTSQGIKFTRQSRPVVVGKVFMLRLQQYSEDKFSATSLASLNSKNENSKNKRRSQFQDRYSSTPIMFGNMEVTSSDHAGSDAVLNLMMIQSLSPQARRRLKKLLTQEDPYDIDIKLDLTSKNRAAEIAKVLLATVGAELVFEKIKREKAYGFYKSPITFLPKYNEDEVSEYLKDSPFVRHPFTFLPNSKYAGKTGIDKKGNVNI